MNLFRSLKSKGKDREDGPPPDPSAPPPEWTAAAEVTHKLGLHGEATDDSYQAGEQFCATYPLERPRLLPSHVVERIAQIGCLAWGIADPRLDLGPGGINAHVFVGSIANPPEADLSSSYTFAPDSKSHASPKVAHISTTKKCQDTSLLSTLPLLAGLYDTQGKQGVYYELLIRSLSPSTTIALGTTCRPYPAFRLPGWNRLSAALHLDDFRKFFEDPDGGRDYLPGAEGAYLPDKVQPGDTFGCGLSLSPPTIFFTYNGIRLPPAFTGQYLPRSEFDVYAAIGIEGAAELEVNFGGDVFRWKEANEWAWRVEGHVGRMTGGSGGDGDELPAYSA